MTSGFVVSTAAVMTILFVRAKSSETIRSRHSVDRPGITRYLTTKGSIHISQLNSVLLSGSYVSSNGHTLHFQSTCSGQVQVERSDGSIVIGLGAVPSHPGIRYLSLQNATFLYDDVGEQEDFKSNLDAYRRAQLAKELRHIKGVRNVVALSDSRTDRNGLIESLLSDVDANTLASLSHSLGEIGVAGHSATCSLPLHLTALSLYRYRNYKISAKHRRHQFSDSGIGLKMSRVHRYRRSCDEFPNADDDCLGMCGYGCKCWKWVCDDCCFHQGCYEHDICCRKGSIHCYFVHKFSCTEFTSCQKLL